MEMLRKKSQNDIPELLEKLIVTITFLNANLLHDIVPGKSVSAVSCFVNTTPTDWFSKRQATVATATYGSELIAVKTATEEIMDLRNTPGVPIMTKAYIFGINELGFTRLTIPQSILIKRQNMVSYHRV